MTKNTFSVTRHQSVSFISFMWVFDLLFKQLCFLFSLIRKETLQEKKRIMVVNTHTNTHTHPGALCMCVCGRSHSVLPKQKNVVFEWKLFCLQNILSVRCSRLFSKWCFRNQFCCLMWSWSWGWIIMWKYVHIWKWIYFWLCCRAPTAWSNSPTMKMMTNIM